MNGCLKISDAIGILNTMRNNGLTVTFDEYDMVIAVNTLEYVHDDNTTAFIPVSDKFVDMDDVFAYTLEMAKKRNDSDYINALANDRIQLWIREYDKYTTEISHGITNFGELAVEGGIYCLLETLINPNSKHDCISDILDIIQHDSWNELNSIEQWLISELFAIRTIYSEQLN